MTDEIQNSIGLLSCPSEVKEKLGNYSAGLADALGDRLAGLYVYGSLARGCFHPATSDVDVVAVVTTPCTEPALSEISRIHKETDIPIDAVFITNGQLSADRFPAPVDFLVKPLSGGEIVRLADGSRDFPLQRQDVYECDVALAGPPPREVVRPVPWPLLAQCLDYLFPHIIPRFKNPALMLCRIAYAYRHRRLCSKRDAGEWAARVFPQQWRPMIEGALTDYSEGVVATDKSTENLPAFERHCTAYMDKLRTGEQ